MPKDGEIEYLRKLGELGRWHAANKPFSDALCHELLEDFAAVLALLPPAPARLLDLGCGTGWTSVLLARRGYDVTGVDIAGDMIAIAERARDDAKLPNLRFVETDYERLDFHAEFDAVVFFDSLHHAVDERLAVQRAYESLKPGGLCLTHEPGAGHSSSATAVTAVRDFGVTEKDMHPAKVISLGRDAGFREFYAFPIPRDNRLTGYSLNDDARITGDGAAARRGPAGPLPSAGWLKRRFHALVRRRLGFTPDGYESLMVRVERVRLACEKHGWQALSEHCGLVVMVK